MNDNDEIIHYVSPESGYEIDDYDTDLCNASDPKEDISDKPDRKKTSKRTKFILLGVVAVIMAGLVFLLVNVFGTHSEKKKIMNLKDYINVEFSGTDSYGTARADIDYDDFMEGILEAMGASEDDRKAVSKAEDVYYSIYIDVDKKDNLSNGSKVKVDASWKQEAADKSGIIIEFEPYSVKVSGLSEYQVVNPFEYVQVSFSGFRDHMYPSIVNVSDDYRLSGVNFYVESGDMYAFLSEGDRVNVYVDQDSADRILKKYGIKLEPMSESYIVSGASEYITNIDYIYYSLLEEAQEDALNVIYDCYPEDVNAEYVGEYFVGPEDGYNSDDCNFFYMIYKGEITDDDGNVHEELIPVMFNSLVVNNSDGTQQIWGKGVLPEIDGKTGTYGYTDEKEMFDKLTYTDRSGYLYQVRGSLKDFGHKVLLPSECSAAVDELIDAGVFVKEGTTISVAHPDGSEHGYTASEDIKDYFSYTDYSYTSSWDIRDFVSSGNINSNENTALLMKRISKALTLGERVTERAEAVSVGFWISSFWFEKDEETGEYYLFYKFT